MVSQSLSRRELLSRFGAFAVVGTGSQAATPAAEPGRRQVRTCLNTALLRGQRLPFRRLVELAAETGYDAIEPWHDELKRALAAGSRPAVLRRLVTDRGLKIPSIIAFPRWIVDDPRQRAKAVDEVKALLELAAALGAEAIAAPPAGATRSDPIPLDVVAERYARLVELARPYGVRVQLELWGFSANLSRLSELAYVLVQCGQPEACALLDVYHLYRGGTELRSVVQLNVRRLSVFHVNDYPADPPRERLTDAHRTYPGDGCAPLRELFAMLYANGFDGYLSIELFRRDLWRQDPVVVARTALRKLRRVVERSKQNPAS